MDSPIKIKRPALRYYGGKWRLAPWIIEHFPVHVCYVEPFGGAASVLLQKQPSTLEVLNDIDSNVINFFQVLRTREAELLRALELTLFSREEFRLAYQPVEDPLERARRFYIMAWQGVGGPRLHGHTGWRFQRNNGRGKSNIDDWTQIDHLPQIVRRLRNVQMENSPFEKIFKRYDEPTTLFYVDPPYLGSTRGLRWSEKGYLFDMTEEDHVELAGILTQLQGMVVLSGYPSKLYDELYEGWQKFTCLSRINSLHGGAQRKTEALWISPAASRAYFQDRIL